MYLKCSTHLQSTYKQIATQDPTLNSLVLFYVEIKEGLERILSENVCEITEKVVSILLQNLDNRFQLTDACLAAAILDPTIQHLPFIVTWLQEKGK